MSIQVEAVSPPSDVVDDAVEAYVCWREESAGACEAYRRWTNAERADRMLAFCAYTAALDREEAAASLYGGAMKRLREKCVDAWRAEPRRAWRGCPS